MSDRLGHYELHEPIGTGMFAVVRRGVDLRFGTEVAVKILAENHALDPDRRERFILEAQVLRRISNPHVITVFDLGETPSGQPYIVLPLCRGGSLRELRPRLEPITPAHAEQLIEALADGLGALHDADIVHRDITPGNVLVDGNRFVIGDLGFAKDLAAGSGLTAAGGTAGFAAPEQHGDVSIVDTRADVYAASAIVLWFVTGRAPGGPIAAPVALPEGFAHLAPGLERGLQPDPADRQPSMDAWCRELAIGTTAPGERGPAVGSGTAVRRLAVAAGLGVAAGALATVAVVAITDDGNSNGERVTLEDGRTRVTAEGSDFTVSLTGPETATVGAPARFTVEAPPDVSIVIVSPEGQVFAGVRELEVLAQSPGLATVTAIAADGTETVTVSLDVEILE